MVARPSGWKGNLCERSLASCVSLFILVPCVALAVYVLLLQTFVLRLEFILAAILLVFYGLEFLFGLVSLLAFSRWTNLNVWPVIDRSASGHVHLHSGCLSRSRVYWRACELHQWKKWWERMKNATLFSKKIETLMINVKIVKFLQTCICKKFFISFSYIKILLR